MKTDWLNRQNRRPSSLFEKEDHFDTNDNISWFSTIIFKHHDKLNKYSYKLSCRRHKKDINDFHRELMIDNEEFTSPMWRELIEQEFNDS